jgi:hypothetical protein
MATVENIEAFTAAIETQKEVLRKYLFHPDIDDEGEGNEADRRPKYRFPYSGSADEAWYNLTNALFNFEQGVDCSLPKIVWINDLLETYKAYCERDKTTFNLEELAEFWPDNLDPDAIAASICLEEMGGQEKT